MFEKPHDPPDLLLMHCETDKMYGIRVVSQSHVEINIDEEKTEVPSDSLLDGHRALITDNLTLSLLAWQKYEN